MTPIDAEHAALLRGIAANTNNKIAQRVYADWLQERGNPGWLIVTSYPIADWWTYYRVQGASDRPWDVTLYFKLPWLESVVATPRMRRISNPKERMKFILTAYANGRVETLT